MAIILKAGTADPVNTRTTKTLAEKNGIVVEYTALYSVLEALTRAQIEELVPSGYAFDSSQLTADGDGLGTLSIKCVLYDDSVSAAALRTTFKVDMAEVQYDLEDHPYLAGTPRDECLCWLATDESARVSNGTYYYADNDGSLTAITDEKVIKFCDAYMAGIRTFNRYYPVIDRITVWSNPPGLSRSGNSFTGGTPTFSSGVGKYNNPPISLNGYPAGNWFKSRDSWSENQNKTWTRTEQWTYTPESSSGAHGWIYTEL